MVYSSLIYILMTTIRLLLKERGRQEAKLHVLSAGPQHSGAYSCDPFDVDKHYIYVVDTGTEFHSDSTLGVSLSTSNFCLAELL